MAEIYASLIRKGVKTIEEVPENLREEVLKILCDSYTTVKPDPLDPMMGVVSDSEVV